MMLILRCKGTNIFSVFSTYLPNFVKVMQLLTENQQMALNSRKEIVILHSLYIIMCNNAEFNI